MSNNRNLLVFIDNIQASLDAIKKYVGAMTFEEYDSSALTQDAVHMRLQVIGENVSKLPVEVRDKFTHIAWHKIRGMRNIISHDYYILDNRIVWQIIDEELLLLEKVLPELQKEIS